MCTSACSLFSHSRASQSIRACSSSFLSSWRRQEQAQAKKKRGPETREQWSPLRNGATLVPTCSAVTHSPKQIVKLLNREGIPGPFGGKWSPSTIHGNPKRGTGILNNELYVGRLVWNRLRYVKNPDTGKRVSRLNPTTEWMSREVPELRIVSDDLWSAAKSRQKHTWQAMKSTGTIGAAKRPQYLFSGLTKCGICGAGFIMPGKNRLGCFGARDQGRCDNHLTIRRVEIETRVLKALQEKLLRQDLFEEFCDEFTREMNRRRMEHRAGLSAAENEIERIEVRRKKLVESIMEGVPASEVRDELSRNAARREELKAKLAAADEPPPLLHPEWPTSTVRRSPHWHRPWIIQKPARKPLRRSEAASTPSS